MPRWNGNGWGFTGETVTFDLEPYIRDALDRVHVEIDRRLAFMVAAEMRKLGWVCTPPDVPLTGPTFDGETFSPPIDTNVRLPLNGAQGGAER